MQFPVGDLSGFRNSVQVSLWIWVAVIPFLNSAVLGLILLCELYPQTRMVLPAANPWNVWEVESTRLPPTSTLSKLNIPGSTTCSVYAPDYTQQQSWSVLPDPKVASPATLGHVLETVNWVTGQVFPSTGSYKTRLNLWPPSCYCVLHHSRPYVNCLYP